MTTVPHIVAVTLSTIGCAYWFTQSLAFYRLCDPLLKTFVPLVVTRAYFAAMMVGLGLKPATYVANLPGRHTPIEWNFLS